MEETKLKTAFEILQDQIDLPKELTIDDVEGTKWNTGVYLSDILECMEAYHAQFQSEQPLLKTMTEPQLERALDNAIDEAMDDMGITEVKTLEQAAEDYSFQVPYDGTDKFCNEDKFNGFKDGAMSDEAKNYWFAQLQQHGGYSKEDMLRLAIHCWNIASRPEHGRHYNINEIVEEYLNSLPTPSYQSGEKTLKALDFFIIRNQLVSMLPTGDVVAWDFIQAIKEYLDWFDKYVEAFAPSSLVQTPNPDYQSGEKWTSTSEKLPETGERVLCNTIYGIQIGWRMIKGDWNFSNGGSQFTIQHWMPLPELPKAPSCQNK